MALDKGYMLIADLSGYTAYLTSTELDHANAVIASLLEVLVARMGDPLHLWRLEGDAVLAYTTDPDFPSGETMLTICEDLYAAFAQRRLDIQANTTCPCQACAKVPELDLKILLHHGAFEQVKIGTLTDISGPDVILVHRLTKTGVRQATGVHSYALMTDAAFQAMDAPDGLQTYAQSFEHFGEVQMHVHDLAVAWDRIRDARERQYVAEEEGMLTIHVHLALPPALAWQVLTAPEAKLKWMGLRSVDMDAVGDRPGPGAKFHCVHEVADFYYTITDWEPFRYVSNCFASCFHPHLYHYETYELVAVEGGTDLRYTAARLFDPADPNTAQPEADEKLLALYQVALTAMLQGLESGLVVDRKQYTQPM